jgi:polar amino acid transport system ATP-binding protein
MTEPLLQIKGLTKVYGAIAVVDRVDLTVSGREIVMLVGPSGAGKSTLLRCINRLEQPTAGTIRVGDMDMTDTNSPKLLASRRRRIGMVFQRFNLFANLTALDNVAIGPHRVLGLSRRIARDRAEQALLRVRLADHISKQPAELSGGQQQRVAIARALAMAPDLMLFDEPTSALDPELVGEVLNVIRGLAEDGMTMLVVTHEMSFARDVGTRVVFMDAGRIVENASPAEFFSAPKTARAQRFLETIRQ